MKKKLLLLGILILLLVSTVTSFAAEKTYIYKLSDNRFLITWEKSKNCVIKENINADLDFDPEWKEIASVKNSNAEVIETNAKEISVTIDDKDPELFFTDILIQEKSKKLPVFNDVKVVEKDSEITLKWEDKKDNEALYYEIAKKEKDEFKTLAYIKSDISKEYEWTEKDLENDKTYYYQVRPVNYAGTAKDIKTIEATPVPNSEEVQNVIDQINSLSDVDIDDEKKIEKTWKLYNILPSEEQEKITNLEKLDKAEKTVTELKKQENQEKADEVKILMENADDSNIEEISSAYKNLSNEQKNLIDDEITEDFVNLVREHNKTSEKIEVISKIDIESTNIKVYPAVYTGDNITPKTKITYKGETLKENTDYIVRSIDNIDVGIGEVSIQGQGYFSGSVIKEFEITPKKIDPVLILTPEIMKYKGAELMPEITVKDGDKELERTDYSLLMQKGRKEPGTYDITIVLKNNYEGRASKTFTIEPRDSIFKVIKNFFS